MPLKTDSIEEPELNLTPMIDIVFLLIIFFMVGAKFTEAERHFPIKLPTVADAPPLTSLPDDVTVSVGEGGRIRVEGVVVTLAKLEGRLKAAHENFPDQRVNVRGEGSGRYQHVMDVLEVCRKAGISNVSLNVKVQAPGANEGSP